MTDQPVMGWWQVDTVLTRPDPEDQVEDGIMSLVREEVDRLERPDDARAFQGVREAYSYDIEPPEGSVGFAFWLRAASAGDAADTALKLIQAACRQAIGAELPVWDIRLLPLEAVLGRADAPLPAGKGVAFRPARRSVLARLLRRP